MRPARVLLSLLFACLAAVPLYAILRPVAPVPARYVPGQLLVRFKEGPRPGGDPRARLLAALGAASLDRSEALGVEKWSLPAGLEPPDAAATARRDEAVQFAEPNYLAQASACGPNDPLLSEQWYYGAIHADQAYCAGTALKVTITVAVLDTGIFAGHQDLVSLIVPGYNFVGNSTLTNDDHNYKGGRGHGTYVASVLAARTGEGIGMAGVAFSNVKLMPVKVLNSAGGGEAYDIGRGIQFAASHGARVINLSLGLFDRSDTIELACNYALRVNCVVVAAAGNHLGGGSAEVSYPAAFPSVISVAALDSLDGPAIYSNFGRVDISAPGGDGSEIACQLTLSVTPSPTPSSGSPSPTSSPTPLSPSPTPDPLTPSPTPSCDCYCQPSTATCLSSTAMDILGACNIDPGHYQKSEGTSFSCPMVAAAAALLLAQDPYRSPADVLRILQETADPTALGPGYNEHTGWGKLNLYRALNDGETAFNVMAPAVTFYSWPNPFRPARETFAHFTFYLDVPQAVRLRLFDMGGDTVYEWNLDSSQTHQGLNFVNWDGRNGVGAFVASGAYSLIFQTGTKKKRINIGVLR